MNCQKCGHELANGSLFCENCGAKAMPAQNGFTQCPTCQSPVAPGARFCTVCGSAIAAPQPPPVQAAYQQPNLPPPPFYPQQPAQQPFAQQPYAQQPYVQQPYAPPYAQQNPYAQQPYQAPPKKKRKGPLVALVILLVIAVLAGAAYALAGKQIKRLILGPKASYLALETSALRSDTADLVEDLVRIGNVTETKRGGKVNLSVDLPGLEAEMDPAMAEAIGKLSLTLTALQDRTGSDPRQYLSADILTQNERLLTLNVHMDKNRIVLSLPDLFSQSISVDEETFTQLADSVGSGVGAEGLTMDALTNLLSMDLDIDEKEMNASINRLIDIVMDHIDEAEFTGGQTLKAGSMSGKYDLYTVTISSESLRQMLIKLLETIREDDEIYNLVSKYAGLAAVSSGTPSADPITRDQYEKGLDEALEDLRKEPKPEEAFTLIQKVYVDSKDEVRGRDITILDSKDLQTGHLQYLNPVDGSKEALLITFEAEGQDSMMMLAEYTVANEAKTGTASLTVGKEQMAKAVFSKLDAVVIDGNDYLLGEFEIEVLDKTAEVPGKIFYKASETGGKINGELGVRSYASVKFGYENIAPDKVTIPTYDAKKLINAADQEALAGLMTEDTMKELTDILSKIGVDMN